MPKKPVLPTTNIFLVAWVSEGKQHWTECVTARVAADVYRQMREFHGDNVRLAHVVLNYGQEI